MRHKYLIVAVVLVTTAGFLARGPALAQRYISNDFVLTHVRVFDGARTLQDTQVAVSGGVIRAVGGDPVAWRHLPTIDATGSTLVPGLIDAHAHVMDAGDLRQALRFGVTTVLDMAATRAEEKELFALRVRARAATDMADLRSAGFPATAPGAHGTEFATEFPAVRSVADAKAFVATRQVEGSDYLKIILNGLRSANTGIQNLDESTAKVLVDAAHAAGLLAVAHVETIGDVDVALAAGIDGLVHVWRRGGADPTRARRLADRKVFVIPALAIPDGFVPEGRANLLVDPRLVPLLSSTIRGHLGRSFSSPTVTDEIRRTNLAGNMAATRSLHAAGVTLLVGTDASPGNPTGQGISVHREIELFREAGLSPAEILAAATMNSAVAFRMPDRGRILPGYRADLLLVRGDPTSDLLSIRDIARIWKGGVEVDRTEAER